MKPEEVVRALGAELQAFIDSLQMFKAAKIKWLEVPGLEGDSALARVYVRRSQRLINRAMQQCMDLSSMEVRSDFQKKGVLSGFLQEMEQRNPWGTIYVENVMDQAIADALRRRGYVTDATTINEGSTCLYKIRPR